MGDLSKKGKREKITVPFFLGGGGWGGGGGVVWGGGGGFVGFVGFLLGVWWGVGGGSAGRKGKEGIEMRGGGVQGIPRAVQDSCLGTAKRGRC